MATGGEKRAALLRQIREEGGFAFVASAEKAAAGDLRAAEAAREMAWEQLHSAPWGEVGPAWRDAYALACLHVAGIRTGDDRRAALRALDMGLIMGGGLLRAELEDAVARVVADHRGSDEGETGGFCGDVEKWKEGLAGDRDLADVLKLLPVKSLSCKQIERRSCISLEAFIRDYFLCESPVILSGCIDNWPARTKWKDIKYLERIAGDRTVPVEVGKNYVCTEWKQELITFSQFLERMWSSDSSKLTYLAQHPLFDQIKELREDITVPEYCYAGGGELQSLNAWLGPHGTVTPLHHDPHHNLVAQVLGRKYFRLYSASVSGDLYPHTETMLSNTSQVDLDNIDEEEFPRAGDLEFMDGILEEGDMLYIPPKWWHYINYGADHLFYLAVDLTFVITDAKTVTANHIIHIKPLSILLIMKFVFREFGTVAQVILACIPWIN
ncbi:lysine-specific demethylase JMJ30-like isoform X2 [Phragmites australis]|uniref:lysine-specific demethylase JMJ30-like isoform X2 n=1 Tax=Phragmites australis TaxID=29695 RepID=UPI002D7A1242|nr:lysine-specific demethylase JMJ30-like isoform X2 [Phragmites australis]